MLVIGSAFLIAASMSFQAIHSGEKKPPPSLLVTQTQMALEEFTPTEYFNSLFWERVLQVPVLMQVIWVFSDFTFLVMIIPFD